MTLSHRLMALVVGICALCLPGGGRASTTEMPGADGKPDLAAEDFVYFGDQANMPYGRYDAAGKADFLRELGL